MLGRMGPRLKLLVVEYLAAASPFQAHTRLLEPMLQPTRPTLFHVHAFLLTHVRRVILCPLGNLRTSHSLRVSKW
jgi:hypothetical protein